jgi:hypothetical protein
MPSTHPPQQLFLRGSLITLRRKCGKPNCHCSKGKPHQTPALSYSFHGKTKILTLREKDLTEVQQALARYRRALLSIETKAQRGIRTLSIRIQREKGGLSREN